MEQGRIGLSTRQGFLDYDGMDVDTYREALGRKRGVPADDLRLVSIP